MCEYLHIQRDSEGICNTLGIDSMYDSKQKVHMNMGPILNGYQDYGKKKIRTILRARAAITYYYVIAVRACRMVRIFFLP
jgi:hypothetical protein